MHVAKPHRLSFSLGVLVPSLTRVYNVTVEKGREAYAGQSHSSKM